MSPFVWIDGRLVPAKKASIPVFDSSFLYGEGLFETLRSVRGIVPFLKDHWLRMRRNARLIGLKFPISFPTFGREITRLLRRNKIPEAYIRMTLSQSLEGRPRLVIWTKPFEPYPRACYRRGGRLVLIRMSLGDTRWLARLKSTSYLTRMRARQEIARRGAVEGVFLNEEGFVTEGASSNLFMVKKGVLLTPPLSDGLLAGTRRGAVLKVARKLGIKTVKKSLRVRDLKNADEIFVTSTLKDILPIGWFEGRKVGRVCPGLMTRRLIECYNSKVKTPLEVPQ